MKSIKEKITFYASALIYLLFNLRLGSTFAASAEATLMQILRTAPYFAGATFIVISFLQYMADGEKLPWDRRFRLFFLIGIMGSLIYGIWDYAGQGVVGQ